MNIRCIALDLDRTTLDGQGHLSPGNREALERAIHKGVHIVIASGRAYTSLPQDMLSVPGIEYAITSNGAAVYHIPTNTCLRRFTLTPGSVEDILSLSAGEPFVFEAFVRGQPYADAAYVRDPLRFGATKFALEYVRRTRKPVNNMPAFLRDHNTELDSVDMVFRDQETKVRLQKRLKENAHDLYITSSIPELLELSHRDGGKHSGVRFIAKTLGLSSAEVAAFGDGDNDADMLSYVGCGIAMENATPACRAAADYITRHHEQDGVACAIRDILHL